jgi:hypothetical protein
MINMINSPWFFQHIYIYIYIYTHTPQFSFWYHLWLCETIDTMGLFLLLILGVTFSCCGVDGRTSMFDGPGVINPIEVLKHLWKTHANILFLKWQKKRVSFGSQNKSLKWKDYFIGIDIHLFGSDLFLRIAIP